MIILDDFRNLYERLTACFRRHAEGKVYVYFTTILIIILILYADSVSAPQNMNIYTFFTNIFMVLVRVHVIGFIVFGIRRYILWAKGTIVSDEARFNTMRKDTMNAIAHEVRTPLAAILGYAENLRLGICEDKKDYYLEQIELKGNEISRMIDEILSLAKLEDSQFAMQNEMLSVNEIVLQTASQYEEPVELHENGEWIIDADREYFTRMIRCLLDNAFRYRKEDTPITIAVDRYSLHIHNQCDPLSENTLRSLYEFHAKPDGRYSFGLFFCRKAAVKNGLKLRVYNDSDGVTASLY